MDTYALFPDGRDFLVRVTFEEGAVVTHRFFSEVEAIAWIVERKRLKAADSTPKP